MRRLLLSIILICLLTVPASAHPGRTDGSGGHYDHDTGEYHYHHGYDAHDHYDMDGDGDTDCPYDFDDQTGRNSGTSTGSPSSTSSRIDDNAYNRGHAAGYDEGYDDGYENGLEEGYEKGRADTKPIILGSIALSAVAAAIFVFVCCRKDHKRRMTFVESSHASELRELDRELRAIKVERDKLLAQQEAVRTGCQARIDQITADCRKQIQNNNAKVEQIEAAARLKIQNCFLDCFDPQRKSTVQFPKDVDFHKWGVSRGVRTMERPFGDLTVYRTASGKCFHAVRGCCGATDPVCVYEERLRHVYGCSKCTDYRYAYRDVPDWYMQYKLLLGGAFAPRPDAPSQSRADTEPRITLGRDQQYRIEMDTYVAPKTTLRMPKQEYDKIDTTLAKSTSQTVAAEDLEYLGRYWGVDTATAFQLLNEDRKSNGLPPFTVREH